MNKTRWVRHGWRCSGESVMSEVSAQSVLAHLFQMGKVPKKKRSVADKVRKAKTSFEIKNNPFEVKINRKKFDVLGRKSKHDVGLPGVSRSKANNKVSKRLLSPMTSPSLITQPEEICTWAAVIIIPVVANQSYKEKWMNIRYMRTLQYSDTVFYNHGSQLIISSTICAVISVSCWQRDSLQESPRALWGHRVLWTELKWG